MRLLLLLWMRLIYCYWRVERVCKVHKKAVSNWKSFISTKTNLLAQDFHRHTLGKISVATSDEHEFSEQETSQPATTTSTSTVYSNPKQLSGMVWTSKRMYI